MRIAGGRSVQNLAIQTMSKVMMSIVVNPVVAVGIVVGHIGVGGTVSAGNVGSGMAGRQTIVGGGFGVPTETDGKLGPLVGLGSHVRVGLGVVEDGTTGIAAEMSLLSGVATLLMATPLLTCSGVAGARRMSDR